MNEKLLEALLDTEAKRIAYVREPTFHMLIDTLVVTLPELVDLMADGSVQRIAKHRAAVVDLEHRGAYAPGERGR